MGVLVAKKCTDRGEKIRFNFAFHLINEKKPMNAEFVLKHGHVH